MPITACTLDGKPGFKWGQQGKCYTYTPDDDASRLAAKKKAIAQALAIGGGSMPQFAAADTSRMAMTPEQLAAALAKCEALPEGPAKDAEKRRLKLEYTRAGVPMPESLKNYEEPPALETVDLEGVDIMAAGERVWGRGSPPEGDVYERGDLEQIAADSNAAVELLKPPNKIGHAFEQKLVKQSGLSDGEMPALGWLRKFRVADDAKGRPKLYVDVLRVPKKFAELVRSGAFRTRSAEIGSFSATDRGEERRYDRVVKGLAWHGAQPSAFRTLDDIYALYLDAGDYQRAYEEDETEQRLVEWATIDPDGAIETVARIFAERITVKPTAADTNPQMPPLKLSEEQDAKLRELLGVDAEAEVDVDQLFAAVAKEGDDEVADLRKELDETKKKLADAEKAKTEGGKQFSDEEIETLKADAEMGRRAFEEARVEKRDRFFVDAVKNGKIEPSKVEDLKKRYDQDSDFVRGMIDSLPENPEWKRVYGSDDDGVADMDAGDAMYEALVGMDGGQAPSLAERRSDS